MTRSRTKSPSPADPGFLEAEVLIVGGGLVGSTLAIALAQAGVDVVVIDTQDPRAGLDAGLDGRASAIALATQRVLAGLGIWPPLEAHAAPIKDIRVSEGRSPFFLHYDHREAGGQPFGFMVENRNLRKALFHRVGELNAIRFLAPAVVTALAREGAGVTADLSNGRKVKARLAVAADGRNSRTREGTGIRVTHWPYEQAAIVCSVAHELSHDFTAHEHFLAAGPFAILPLMGDPGRPGHCSSIVWTERADLAPTIMTLDEKDFMAELQRRFGDFLGDLEVIGPKWSYPLSLRFAERTIDKRLALVGDAAHAMHPIAGQGLNMGLRDVAALAEVVVDAKRLGLDIGDGTVLEGYQRWRRFDNTLMLAMTDGLNRLFSNHIRPLRLARDIGLAAVNKLPPLKKVFMRQAMGLVGDLPRLMRNQPL
ncbi:MAG: 2-octaprenyl-6-methoxyphenyl hydroxylase [Rhodospirillaceae bacterium]|jgi:2-octaprenyl-6-methoxyphenol hydroxylase|nr:2-octaprenyl-6-methoxyphenyl hydroxylase [Rhodospirillaceae bacterium]|tara:strand:+ start:2404 stop:3675 length:1272 start_codon:yes stop_codon:yes gene_type:complete